ncbi:serine hydrolase domain-containing protein [Alicyclobacillus kakegawensis]|uniref:serine hydrolase domain-containing protein n=1 Tax=Alicyclobacillus kakegawensis TaxID=392012 RepID=UPI000830A6EE|nr:serine hydrolase domain-containing protein [Alicyclobacillus kakegawensis]
MYVRRDRLTALGSRLQQEVDSFRIPGAVVALGNRQEIVYFETFGYAENRNGAVRKMSPDTLFDLASLTKVVATLPSLLMLMDDGRLRLSDKVVDFIPEFPDHEVCVLHLLTHTSGLPASRPYHRICKTPDDIWHRVRTETLEYQPGTRVVYSDVGFMLLAQIIQVVSGQPIDEYARQHVFQPLRMNRTTYCPSRELQNLCAATEASHNGPAKVGIVHDENAEAMGGISGHAGLFAPMTDLIRYVQMWTSLQYALLSSVVRRVAVRCHTADLDGRRGLGWVCRGDRYDHMGDTWPQTAVGHTGFTGTSLAFDPETGLWMILLTNDVHYGRENRTIVRLRSLLHNIAGSAIVP